MWASLAPSSTGMVAPARQIRPGHVFCCNAGHVETTLPVVHVSRSSNPAPCTLRCVAQGRWSSLCTPLPLQEDSNMKGFWTVGTGIVCAVLLAGSIQASQETKKADEVV